MCQLLGMNANVPTDICFSFEGFRARGGLTDEHKDGWGIAFFEGLGVRVFLDPAPACHSPIADLVRSYPINSSCVVAHIRRATQGRISLENCHPFQRELWGRPWVFAHNGNLEGMQAPSGSRYTPIGTTDSEAAFCTLLEGMLREFPNGAPALADLAPVLARCSAEIAGRGPFNYLLSNGNWLFARCATRLHYITRQAPFRKAHLIDEDVTVDFQHLTSPGDKVSVIATIPLTDDENWTAMQPGELVVFCNGAPVTAER